MCDGYDAVVAVSPKTEQYLYKINVQSPIYQIPNVLILPNSPILDSKIDVKSTKEIVNLDLKNSLKNVEQLDTNSKPNKPVKPNNSKQTRSQNLISNSTLQNPKSNKFYFKEKFPNLPIDVENSFNFVTFGRIAKEKSLEIGIEILEPLLQKYPIYYLIAGIGPEMENLESFIKKKNLENKVFLIGKYDNESLSDFCEFCDVFVNTSTSENLPTTDFEALSFGLPVVAIDDLAHRFFVENSNLDFLENLKKKSNQNEWKNNQEKSLALTQKKTHNLTAIFENKLHRKLQDEINWLSLQSKPFAKFLEYIKKTQNKIEIQNQKTFQNWFQSSSKVTLINRQKQKNKTLVGKIHQNNSNSNLGFGLENNSQKKLQNNFISEKFPIEIGAKLSNWTNKNQIWVNKNFPKIAELIQKSQENENWQIGQLNPNIWEKKIKSESLSTNIANLKKGFELETEQNEMKNTNLEEEIISESGLMGRIGKILKDKNKSKIEKSEKLPNGFCVELSKMTLCCEKLYLDKDLRKRLSQNAYKTAQTLAKRPVESEYLKLYQDLIDQNKIEKLENQYKFSPVFENFEELTEKLQNSWQNWLRK